MKIIHSIFLFFIVSTAWTQRHYPLQVAEYEITHWEYRMVGDSIWKPAKVPGTIIDNFIDLADISNPLHPYYGNNEKLYQWIGEKDWEFRTHMDVDSNLLANEYTYTLYFGCLDVFADVYINDFKLQSNNAFIPLECTDLRDPHLNVLIKFHSTLDSINKMLQNDSLKYPGGGRVYARTAQYQFGWDWGPQFINMGIRKPVTLRMVAPTYTHHTHPYVRIDGLRFEPWNIEKKNGSVAVFIDGKTNCDSLEWHLKVFLNGDSIDGFDGKWHNNLEGAYLYYLKNPQLWWPNGCKKQSNYYEFDIRFTIPGDTNTLAHQHAFYAACNIQLEQKKDKKGESFTFKVNGENIYAKGANYIPDDSFHPGKNTKQLIKLSHDANMNMLRVWGGGTYPNDDFYIECMKNGIMVWQDYMFACAMYPVNADFLYNVEQEAYTQMDRLYQYNHIAVWCGNNENEEGWKNWGWQKEMKISPNDSTDLWNGYVELFQNYLKTIRYDSTTYISTSPKYGWGRKESMTDGDSHYWGVWWGLEPLEKYNEKVPRFMSEFGMQAMPDLTTLKKVIPDSAMNFDSPFFKNHQKHPTGFKTLDHYLKEYLVIPENIEDYAYATQVLQAYALTMAIEAQRRAMPYCMGSLLWQLNDCWPVTSWSIIDYSLKSKISYNEVSRVYAPILISIKENTKCYDIIINNSSFYSTKDQLNIQISDFYGKVLWKKKLNIRVKENSSLTYFTIPKTQLKTFDFASIFMQVKLGNDWNDPTTFFHFVRLKELQLPAPVFKVEYDERNDMHNIVSNVYCPYTIAAGQYIGTLIPGEKSYLLIEDDQLGENLFYHPENIKCLNTLLKK